MLLFCKVPGFQLRDHPGRRFRTFLLAGEYRLSLLAKRNCDRHRRYEGSPKSDIQRCNCRLTNITASEQVVGYLGTQQEIDDCYQLKIDVEGPITGIC